MTIRLIESVYGQGARCKRENAPAVEYGGGSDVVDAGVKKLELDQ